MHGLGVIWMMCALKGRFLWTPVEKIRENTSGFVAPR